MSPTLCHLSRRAKLYVGRESTYVSDSTFMEVYMETLNLRLYTPLLRFFQ